MRLACIIFLFASLAAAQATDPKLSDTAHAKIRDVQLQQKNIENQYMQLQQQIVNLQAQFNGLNEQLKTETDAAYKEAGVKREEWTLDMATLKFTKVEKKAETKK
jgi:septal ring factor EnvC (AmiA/AmiB activator)